MSRTFIPVGLRRLVHERAAGRCEYCAIPETFSFAAHHIDHIVAEKHDGPTNPDNLALCCTLCNRYKGSDLTAIDPQTGNIVTLFDPRQDTWATHFNLPADGTLRSDTPTGRATIRLLQLNRPERIEERRMLLLSGLWPQPTDG